MAVREEYHNFAARATPESAEKVTQRCRSYVGPGGLLWSEGLLCGSEGRRRGGPASRPAVAASCVLHEGHMCPLWCFNRSRSMWSVAVGRLQSSGRGHPRPRCIACSNLHLPLQTPARRLCGAARVRRAGRTSAARLCVAIASTSAGAAASATALGMGGARASRTSSVAMRMASERRLSATVAADTSIVVESAQRRGLR